MFRIAVTSLCIAALSACATQPDPCTPEWVEWKSDKILKSFALDNRGFIRDLRKLEGQFESPSLLAAAQLLRVADEAGEVISDFKENVVPELRAAYNQCGSVDKLMPTFTKFLRQEGLSDETIRWIEGLGAFIEAYQKDA